MPLTHFKNSLDGPSLRVTPPSTLSEVPTSFAGMLTKDHRSAFGDPRSYFAALADECDYDVMKGWLKKLAASEHVELEFHMSKMSSPKVIVRIAGFGLSLREPVSLPSFSKLGGLYGLISATWEFEYGEAGGLRLPRYLEDYERRGGGKVPGLPEGTFAFYCDSSGQEIIEHRGVACWLTYGGLSEIGTISEMLSAYFRHLENGDLWRFNPNPPAA